MKNLKGKFSVIVLIFYAFFTHNCEAQNTNKNFKGDWQIVKDGRQNVVYQEAFVNDDYIVFYDLNWGAQPRIKYYLKGESLFQSEFESDFEKVGTVQFNSKDEFVIKSKSDSVRYRRLMDGETSLGDYLNYEVSENEYRKSFIRRLETWESKR